QRLLNHYIIIHIFDVSFSDTFYPIFLFFLFSYLFIMVSNLGIAALVFIDRNLHQPMYLLFCNLPFNDILGNSIMVPRLLMDMLLPPSERLISYYECVIQMFVFIMLSVTGRATLTVMAYDRYVAICSPLYYSSIMTLPVRLLLVVGAWTFGTACTLPAISMASRRYYCGANVVKHGWCDPTSVRRLVCGDTLTDSIVSLTFGVVAMLTTGVLILTSYILIGLSIFRMGIGERLKAFKTCAAHLTVVTISYSAAVRIIVSVLYSALTPFLNPLIYSLRNSELRESIRRTLRKLGPTNVLPMKGVNTVS
uniref:G-protein coupled receptors family 1 profile domain-containing protein n=1 Tax=Salarias fasciatus TaxID=181472 RepID=A0A672HBM2_SALFA